MEKLINKRLQVTAALVFGTSEEFPNSSENFFLTFALLSSKSVHTSKVAELLKQSLR